MVFVEDPRNPTRTSPFRTPSPARTPERGGVEALYRPESLVNSVANVDPDFSYGAFAYLANSLQLVGDSFEDICDANAEVSVLRCLVCVKADAFRPAGIRLRRATRCEPALGDAQDLARRQAFPTRVAASHASRTDKCSPCAHRRSHSVKST